MWAFGHLSSYYLLCPEGNPQLSGQERKLYQYRNSLWFFLFLFFLFLVPDTEFTLFNKVTEWTVFLFSFLFTVLGIGPRALCMLGKLYFWATSPALQINLLRQLWIRKKKKNDIFWKGLKVHFKMLFSPSRRTGWYLHATGQI